MTLNNAATILTSKGWKTLIHTGTPENDLNTGITHYFVYQDKLTARFYGDENLLRLFIYGKASQPGFEVNFISQIDPSFDQVGHNDVRALQFEYEENELEDLVNAIVDIQDTLTIESYFDAYFSLQAHASVAILAVEQFI